jgi:hypothetical protein
MKPVTSLACPDGRTVRVVRLERRLAAAIGLLSLGGCASTQLGAQYVDPQFPQQALRGATLLVVCEAPEPAIKLICESQISSQLTQLGARPLTDSTLVNPTPGHEPPPGHYLPAAQATGARAVFSTTLMPDYWRASPMSSFSIGIGGWGGSGGYYGGSGVGGGVGVTMPVGGAAQGVPGLAAIGSVIDVASGRVMWTAKATTPPAADASTQVVEVTKALAEAARQTGLF